MAGIKVPVIIDGFECVEDMAKTVLNYTFKGKTLKEWADSVSKPKTNADRIRSMSDEELANIICCQNNKSGEDCYEADCIECTLDWLREDAK